MKYLIVLFLLFILSGTNLAQGNEKEFYISSPQFGLYAGIVTENYTDINGALFIEGTSQIHSNIKIKLAFGYNRSCSSKSYDVETNDYYNINSVAWYNAVSYKVLKTKYDSIPLSFGLEYEYQVEKYKPYLDFQITYRWIGASTLKTSEIGHGYYPSLEQLPQEYKSKDMLPLSSWGYGVGIGLRYKLTTALISDVRYVYQIDNQTVNTHQIIFGIIL